MGALLSRSEKQGFTFSSSVHVDSSSKKNKKPIRKSMIGKPADFIHLTHAGMDLTNNNSFYIPIVKVQISDIQMASSNYANSYSYKLMQKQLRTQNTSTYHYAEEGYNNWEEVPLPMRSKKLTENKTQVKKTHGAGNFEDKLDHAAVFFDELYKVLQEKPPQVNAF